MANETINEPPRMRHFIQNPVYLHARDLSRIDWFVFVLRHLKPGKIIGLQRRPVMSLIYASELYCPWPFHIAHFAFGDLMKLGFYLEQECPVASSDKPR